MNAAQVRESAHTAVSELVCDLGEYAMRDTKRQRGQGALRRVFHSWPSFLARYYTAETWRKLPGPWPVKAALAVLCLAIPGPFDEIALIAVAGFVAARKTGTR